VQKLKKQTCSICLLPLGREALQQAVDKPPVDQNDDDYQDVENALE